MKMRIDAAVAARRRGRMPDPTGELLRLQPLRYNPHSLVSIAPGPCSGHHRTSTRRIYGEFGRVWLAAGDPLAPWKIWLSGRQFAAFAKKKNRVVAFVPTSAELLARSSHAIL